MYPVQLLYFHLCEKTEDTLIFKILYSYPKRKRVNNRVVTNWHIAVTTCERKYFMQIVCREMSDGGTAGSFLNVLFQQRKLINLTSENVTWFPRVSVLFCNNRTNLNYSTLIMVWGRSCQLLVYLTLTHHNLTHLLRPSWCFLKKTLLFDAKLYW